MSQSVLQRALIASTTTISSAPETSAAQELLDREASNKECERIVREQADCLSDNIADRLLSGLRVLNGANQRNERALTVRYELDFVARLPFGLSHLEHLVHDGRNLVLGDRGLIEIVIGPRIVGSVL